MLTAAFATPTDKAAPKNETPGFDNVPVGKMLGAVASDTSGTPMVSFPNAPLAIDMIFYTLKNALALSTTLNTVSKTLLPMIG